MHIAGQEIFFPVGAAGIVVYPMGFFFHLLMFSGIYLASKLVNIRTASGKQFDGKQRRLYFVGFATAFRGGFMPIIDYAVLYSYLLPLVFNTLIPEAYIVALVPSFILYNVTSTLYAVPIAYIIAKRASTFLKIETSIPFVNF